ncbi:hypothetical protein BS17DRAFT_765347 [Gyrodon lividus]|nr:hypothetical protein BS17DRAFT_765347 [Gyrodon lividus]
MNGDHSTTLPDGNLHRRFQPQDISALPRIPTYRHAAPSAPWPWMDLNTFGETQPSLLNEFMDNTMFPWRGYPQNLFRNWTSEQVERSKMLTARPTHCLIHRVDMLDGGCFGNDGISGQSDTLSVPSDSEKVTAFWDELQRPMLGTRFRIGPSFFSSSTNWIPSRYQEDLKTAEGDHITIVLPFVRVVSGGERSVESINGASSASLGGMIPLDTSFQNNTTQSTPECHSICVPKYRLFHTSLANHILFQDLLAIHMVRAWTCSTVLSYHPKVERSNDSAKRLQSLVLKTGDSDYWSEIFAKSKDGTFLVLVMFWYVLYGWDEAFEVLSPHIDWLEVYIFETNDIYAAQELHKLRSTLLYYEQHLQDFRKSLMFLRTTPNPAMKSNINDLTEEERKMSVDLFAKEVNNLLFEVDRLESQTAILSSRLKNLMDLAFAMDNIEERKAATRDSSTMKQISYLTMVFLPASFIASVFGMNVVEINPGSSESIAHYAEATIAVSFITGWLLVAVQAHSTFHSPGSDIWRRLAWPVFCLWRFCEVIFGKGERRRGVWERKGFESMV